MHLPHHAVEQVLLHERGISIGELRAAAERGGASNRACAGCGGELAGADIDGVEVDLCRRCGGVWFDGGELEEISHGRHAEREQPVELAREVLPGRQSKRAYVPEHRTASQLFSGAVTALVGVLFVPFVGIGLPILAHGLLGRTAFVVDFAAGRVGLRNGRSERNWIPLAAAQAILISPVAFQKQSGEPDGYHVEFHGRGTRPPLRLFVRDRVLAHRYAFQLSQLTGVRITAG